VVSGLVLANAILGDAILGDPALGDARRRGNVRIVGDRVAAVGPGVAAGPGDDVLDLSGYVLLPGPAEPHAHLDKAFTAGLAHPGDGSLAGAIDAWLTLRGQLDQADFTARARRGALAYLSNGATVIRAHTDASPALGTMPLAALRTVRAELDGAVDIEFAAMAGNPLTGAAGRENVAALRDAIDAGADVVGGAPWLDTDPAAACGVLLDLAAAAGLPVDLHVDETTDPAADTLGTLIALARQGFPHRLTASHVVSLASRPRAAQHRTAAALAEAGIGVVTLPQTNLWLQGRAAAGGPPDAPGDGALEDGAPGDGVASPVTRGLTPVTVLLAAGVTVAAGADNIRDPFNPLSRADPLETAALLAAAAHLTPAQALTTVTAGAWAVLGRPAPAFRPGEPARFVAVAALDADDAVASAPPDRIVIRGSRVVARTRTVREYYPSQSR
jgi:cytosine/creatinine deaminase